MIGSSRWRRAGIAFGIGVAVSASLSAAANTKLSVLSRLEPGLWQLRDLDNARAPQQALCIADPVLLTQLRHRDTACTRLVVADGERDAVVHYTCPASGFGQTALRFETPRLAQIDTQGIAGNQPFAFRAEARRLGPCPGPARR